MDEQHDRARDAAVTHFTERALVAWLASHPQWPGEHAVPLLEQQQIQHRAQAIASGFDQGWAAALESVRVLLATRPYPRAPLLPASTNGAEPAVTLKAKLGQPQRVPYRLEDSPRIVSVDTPQALPDLQRYAWRLTHVAADMHDNLVPQGEALNPDGFHTMLFNCLLQMRDDGIEAIMNDTALHAPFGPDWTEG